MLNKDIEKKYRNQVKKSHPRSGATWQRDKVKPGKKNGDAYWDFVQQNRLQTETGELDAANPDNLSYGQRGDIQTLMLNEEHIADLRNRVRKLLELSRQVLTEQQYNVFVLMVVKEPHLTEREAAKVLSLSAGRIHQLWAKAQVKLRDLYDKRTA